MRQPGMKILNQVIEEPFLGVLRELRAAADPRLPIVLKTANLNGWTYQALGNALGITREGVRLKIAKAALRPEMELPEIPTAPRRRAVKRNSAKSRLRIKPEVADRLYGMYLVASTVTGGTSADAPERRVSEEYTAALASLVDQGVSVNEIARTIGVHHSGIHSRLARHGYRTPSPSQAVDAYKGRPAKVAGEQAKCKWDHPLSGENLRIISTTGARACKACERRRAVEYRERQLAASGPNASGSTP